MLTSHYGAGQSEIERDHLGVHLAVRGRSIDIDSLQLEQDGLSFQAAGKTRQATIGCDHAMAGHEDRDRIGTNRLAHGTSLVRLSKLACELSIRRYVTMLYLEQLIVHLALEVGRRTRQIERNVERGPLLREVLPELLYGCAKLSWPRLRGIRVSLSR